MSASYSAAKLASSDQCGEMPQVFNMMTLSCLPFMGKMTNREDEGLKTIVSMVAVV